MARQRDDSPRTFSLVPIMNLATLLIPVLLMGSQFLAVKFLDPGPSAVLENPGDDRVEAVVPVVDVSEGGFRISGAEEVLAGPDGQPILPCASGSCGNSGSYDYSGLRRLLGHVKDAYPWADEVILIADERVPYEVLVRAMDAAREDTGQRELFPRVILRNR